MSDLDLSRLRATAEAATPGPWRQWNPAAGPSHITIGGKVAFESLQSATSFADDEVIPHWCDAAHIAAFDPETVLTLLDLIAEQQAEIQRQHDALVQCGLRELRDEKRIAEQQAELAQVEAFINQRPEYVAALRNTRGGDSTEDYCRWSGHAEARRQLATSLNLTTPYEPGEKATRYEVTDDEA